MGKRVPEYITRKMGTQKLISMFIPPEIRHKTPSLPAGFHYPAGCGYSNEIGYGYMLNLNNTQIFPIYEAFRKWLGTTYPISDEERKFFEADMIYSVFRREFETSPIYSSLDLNRSAEILLKDSARYMSWVSYRTELFGERKEAG